MDRSRCLLSILSLFLVHSSSSTSSSSSSSFPLITTDDAGNLAIQPMAGGSVIVNGLDVSAALHDGEELADALLLANTTQSVKDLTERASVALEQAATLRARTGSYLYMLGGFAPTRQGPTDVVIRLDASEAAVAMPSLLQAREKFSAVTYRGLLYVIGGLSVTAEINSVEVFDGTAWQRGPPLPGSWARMEAVVFNHRILVFGGTFNGLASKVMYSGDGAVWEKEPASLLTERRVFASAVYRQQVFAMGGEVSGAASASVEVYDGIAWRTSAPLTTPRAQLASAVFLDRIYVVGGNSSMEVFDGTAWTALSVQVPFTAQFFAMTVFNSQLYALGGGSSPRAAHRFNGTAWEPIAWATATRLSDTTCCLELAVFQA